MSKKLNLDKSLKLYEEAKKLSPGGMLGIRRPYNFVDGEYPIFIERGHGGKIYDVDGNEYIDMLCAYGPIIMGYVEEEINNAVIEQMKKGFCFSMVQEVQNTLEEKLIELIPSAEMAVLAKTGSDATSIATRVARGYTGKDKILRCGYHGWHDWCVEVKNGIPKAIQDLTIEFEYGCLDDLESKLKANKDEVACIIITPLGHPLADVIMEPPSGYLEAVQKLAKEHNAVLIFDEIRTGFRLSMGGAQKYYGVTPDLSVFGKAMANGYPISACVGKKEIMKVMEKSVFVSSTFFPNSLEMVAALKCIEILERDNVLQSIIKKGTRFMQGVKKHIDTTNGKAELTGLPQMSFITFPKVDDKYKERRTAFYTECIRNGLFIQPYHHGYICDGHTDEDIEKSIDIIGKAIDYINENF